MPSHWQACLALLLQDKVKSMDFEDVRKASLDAQHD